MTSQGRESITRLQNVLLQLILLLRMEQMLPVEDPVRQYVLAGTRDGIVLGTCSPRSSIQDLWETRADRRLSS
jgi:hypothetical protein